MGTSVSSQLSARPFRLETILQPEEIVYSLFHDPLNVRTEESPSGWGSVQDSAEVLGLSIPHDFTPMPPMAVDATDSHPDRVRARFYWTKADSRARRQSGSDDWRLTHVLEAADVLLYKEQSGSYSGLITVRTPREFQRVLNAFISSVEELDSTASVATDTIPELLPGDFFLWLFYRQQTNRNLEATGLKLIELTALSSMNRNKGARFKDGATLERVELVSLIATSQGRFGPAKFSINSEPLSAGFDMELFSDGGFLPFRSSDYPEEQLSREELGLRLFDDIWVHVLPGLRETYRQDAHWEESGRQQLKEICIEAVQSALESSMRLAALHTTD